jgi:diketogulonate reductase-like aldo/keto reductase
MAYSPLGNPSKPVTRVWDENAKTILQDEKLLAMAKKYNKTVAQICIRFGIQRGLILIPKVTFFIIRYFIFFSDNEPSAPTRKRRGL